jgi:IS30 family transposase
MQQFDAFTGGGSVARHYRRLSAADRAAVWARWQRGETLLEISEALGTVKSNVWWLIDSRGGLVPPVRRRAARALQLGEREEISRGLAHGESVRSLARRLGRAPSTISREIRRHGGHTAYRATTADAAAWTGARRPKRCRLAQEPRLCRLVAQGLRRDWSPQQIARWLVTTFRDEPTLHVSHETIYRTLYVQARGALKRELAAHLRRGQRYRRPRAATHALRGRGHLLGTVSIAARPLAADTRAVPGHWEGDLLLGHRGTQIATLVERQSRFVILVRLPAADSGTVIDALARRITRLPAVLQQSLTWDRGKEMAQHQRFTIETGIQIYFCDPQSPWQRGSNENTNGLLRQYFPKGTDLSTITQRQLDAVALKLNTRPRMTLNWQNPATVLAATVAMTG